MIHYSYCHLTWPELPKQASTLVILLLLASELTIKEISTPLNIWGKPLIWTKLFSVQCHDWIWHWAISNVATNYHFKKSLHLLHESWRKFASPYLFQSFFEKKRHNVAGKSDVTQKTPEGGRTTFASMKLRWSQHCLLPQFCRDTSNSRSDFPIAFIFLQKFHQDVDHIILQTRRRTRLYISTASIQLYKFRRTFRRCNRENFWRSYQSTRSDVAIC